MTKMTVKKWVENQGYSVLYGLLSDGEKQLVAKALKSGPLIAKHGDRVKRLSAALTKAEKELVEANSSMDNLAEIIDRLDGIMVAAGRKPETAQA